LVERWADSYVDGQADVYAETHDKRERERERDRERKCLLNKNFCPRNVQVAIFIILVSKDCLTPLLRNKQTSVHKVGVSPCS